MEEYKRLAAARSRLEDLIQTLRLSLHENGTVTRAEINYLAEAIKPLSLMDLYKAIEKAALRLNSSVAHPDRSDVVKYDRIDGLIYRLGKANLYEFLGKPSTAALGDLVEQADVEYARVDAKSEKSPERELIQQLAGDARAVFKSLSDQQAYDDHLADRKLEVLGHHVALLAQRGCRISTWNVEVLRQRGIALGDATSEQVSRYVKRYLEARDIAIYDERTSPGRPKWWLTLFALILGILLGRSWLAPRLSMPKPPGAVHGEAMKTLALSPAPANSKHPIMDRGHRLLTTAPEQTESGTHLPRLRQPNETRRRPVVSNPGLHDGDDAVGTAY